MDSRDHITTTDNNLGKCELLPHETEILEHLSGRKLDELQDENDGQLWIFPQKNERYSDQIEDDTVFSIIDNRLITNNIMGFIGYHGLELNIKSRFSDTKTDDWFMQYMLEKVFSINIFNLEHSKNELNALDIATLLFPYFLTKAMNQGLYREYTKHSYNDNHLRGTIDFNLHVKNNYPFINGKISYTTRERVYDNNVTQLIRHTIEFIRKNESSYSSIFTTAETTEYIRQIIEATSSYKKGDLKKVMLNNMHPKVHPYYSEYQPLQKLCLQILNRQKLGYTEDGDKIHGVLFNGAWLWEAYLNTILSNIGFEHPDNKTKEKAIYPFVGRDRKYSRYPDFIKEGVIVDAKYKRCINEIDKKLYDNIQRDDLNQIITYLHVTGYRTGIFITPNDLPTLADIHDNDFTRFLHNDKGYTCYDVGTLTGDGGHIFIIGLKIPTECKDYEEFKAEIIQHESELSCFIKRM